MSSLNQSYLELLFMLENDILNNLSTPKEVKGVEENTEMDVADTDPTTTELPSSKNIAGLNEPPEYEFP